MTTTRASPGLSCTLGIPLGLANYKLIPVSLLPLGREIVSVDQLHAVGDRGYVTIPDRR